MVNGMVTRWGWLLLLPLSVAVAPPPCQNVLKTSPSASSLYQLEAKSTSITSDEAVNVVLKSAGSGDPFKSYLMVAFDDANNRPIGTFSQPSDGHVVDCFNGIQNAVESAGRSPTQRSVDVTWTPPEGFRGGVHFRASVVGPSDQAATVVAAITVEDRATSGSTTEMPVEHPVYGGCGQTKGCYGYPKHCVDTLDCSMLFTYKNLSDTLFELELYGHAAGDSYVAVGFSADKKMGDDSVVECVHFGDSVNAYLSFNVHEDNHRNPDNVGMNVIESSYVEDNVYCKVTHVAQWTADSLDFDLLTPYYLLMARGPSDSRNIKEHTKDVRSEGPIDLTLKETLAPAESRLLKILHGSFMVTAWLISASIGTFLPRYMNKTWVGKQLMGKDLWFFYHRGLMGCAWLLTSIAFVLIFIEEEGWGPSEGRGLAHGVIGCIVTGVAFVQPIGAAFRPAPNAPNRKFFNVAHSLAGYLVHLLAITCIFLAVEMDDTKLPFYTYWILTAHIVCYVLGHCALTVLANKYQSATNAGGDAPGSRKRKMILAVLSTVLTGLTIATIVFIAGVASQ